MNLELALSKLDLQMSNLKLEELRSAQEVDKFFHMFHEVFLTSVMQ